MNYTSQIMTQMNEMVEYFSLNETGVAGLLDNSDVNVSVQLIIELKYQCLSRIVMTS